MISVKPWSIGHAPEVVRLRNLPELKRWFRQEEDLTVEEQVSFMKTRSDYHGYLVWFEDKVVGFVAWIQDHNPNFAEFSVGIDPAYQQRGIATEAMTQLEAQAKASGIKFLYSDVFLDNPALSFYLHKCGFKAVKAKEDYCYKQGVGVVDAIRICKAL
jgi:ribosomal protein S18 acetylase RimI-like enzyme